MGVLTVHVLLMVLCSTKEALYQHLTSIDTVTSITESPGAGKAYGRDEYEGTTKQAAEFRMPMSPLPLGGRCGAMAQDGRSD